VLFRSQLIGNLIWLKFAAIFEDACVVAELAPILLDS